MQAQRRYEPDTRLRAVALLLVGILAVALVSRTHAPQAHKHSTHRVAALAATAYDFAHGTSRVDAHGANAAAPQLVAAHALDAHTSDASAQVSSRTGHAPQVRGPPAQHPA